MTETVRDQVFISYSHKDTRWRDDLLTHLRPLLRNSVITSWSDQQIKPGSKWLDEIRDALSKTRVGVFLVTADFLASDFIHDEELTPLLREAKTDDVTILWIPVRACSHDETPLKDYQAIINPGKPLATMKVERDNAWVEICRAIKEAVNP